MNFTFTTDQINTILKMLDAMPHGQVRGVVDFILSECNRQQTAAEQPKEQAEAN